jgi:hypothetical protein
MVFGDMHSTYYQYREYAGIVFNKQKARPQSRLGKRLPVRCMPMRYIYA